MRKTPLNKIGKKGRENLKYREIIKGMYLPETCELKLSGCHGGLFLTIAHRHKRSHYKTAEELADKNEIVIACVNCHETIEHDKELTEKIFKKLRG